MTGKLGSGRYRSARPGAGRPCRLQYRQLRQEVTIGSAVVVVVVVKMVRVARREFGGFRASSRRQYQAVGRNECRVVGGEVEVGGGIGCWEVVKKKLQMSNR
ncbi:hypothetical protein LY78DRAFT_69943 [Colletotrichum sublineola]|nr:hypothetical protein LY78DRAFT_69943 [Colletotrichum sublineola]